jgi:hypothetical protein
VTVAVPEDKKPLEAMVPGHFDAIGFPIEDREGLDELASLAAHKGQPLQVSGGYYIRFGFGDGPELWAQANADRQIIGCNPHFAGSASMRARVDRLVPSPRLALDGALRATAINTGGADYPFQCDLPDFAGAAPQLRVGAEVDLQVAAFAEQVQCFASVDQFRADKSRSMNLATEAFIPSGLFDPSGKSEASPRSQAILSGSILSSELRSNRLTTVPYQYLLVRSLGGTFDVVAEQRLFGGSQPRKGGIIFGSFWLSARVVISSK